ncbi:unnamed protein product [Heligmosomoides polygyrus]|uniref:MADF domain-containing protein n=1 Tax=Heligmosomoides polygyrus TaxID=6339 RepID=A0A183FWK0_HELPZ|nr:unnamed protein product [Heligmosomoides polygyrus]
MLPKRAKVEMVEREGLTIQERYALIETVRNFPAVWDDRNVDYKDPIKRAQAWTMIMHEMEELTARTMTVEELSRVFKNLRDTFRRKKKEHREHSDSHSRIREWPFYESLSYLDPVGLAYSADFAAIGLICVRWAPLSETAIYIAILTSFTPVSAIATNAIAGFRDYDAPCCHAITPSQAIAVQSIADDATSAGSLPSA